MHRKLSMHYSNPCSLILEEAVSDRHVPVKDELRINEQAKWHIPAKFI